MKTTPANARDAKKENPKVDNAGGENSNANENDPETTGKNNENNKNNKIGDANNENAKNAADVNNDTNENGDNRNDEKNGNSNGSLSDNVENTVNLRGSPRRRPQTGQVPICRECQCACEWKEDDGHGGQSCRIVRHDSIDTLSNNTSRIDVLLLQGSQGTLANSTCLLPDLFL